MSIRDTEEVEPWRDTKLKCGIGHIVSGRVRRVRYLRCTPEGDLWWDQPTDAYDPERCVVCGLWITNLA